MKNLVFLALFLSSCMNRAPAIRMLDQRAQYQDSAKAAKSLEVIKTKPQVRKIWIYPFELESGDYFWGGFISIVTEQDRWSVR